MTYRTTTDPHVCLIWSAVLSALLLSAPAVGAEALPCVAGMVSGYPCDEIILVGHLSEAEMATSGVSDN
ncbi:MAG: hypothetical protein V3T72_14510, partial [Thermoanaerobaculia bacterium]